MARRLGALFVSLLLLLQPISALGPPQLAQKRWFHTQNQEAHRLRRREDVDPALLYPAYNLSVPIDHFHNDTLYEPHSNGTFNLRYWFDAINYKPGGPVVVLASGETSGVGRLPFLQKGIVSQLTQATNGLGVILEHRYYGTSIPNEDLEDPYSTENLRFLTTDQALADTAYWMKNVKFEGIDADLTAPGTPYILYGGSYAGGFVAFMRKLYPDITWGAISSSGVTEAIWDYWEYYSPHAEYGPPACISNTQDFTAIVDNILIDESNSAYVQPLKEAFGIGNLTHNDDFAYVISWGIGGWQGRNWDPEINDPSFDYYCNNITSSELLYPELKSSASNVSTLISAGGGDTALTTQFLNYIGYVNATVTGGCEYTDDQCFSFYNASLHTDSGQARSWPYQYCTQWGYLQTGSGVPAGQKPLISRLIDLPYTSLPCSLGFNITTPPNITAINKYGGLEIRYPRLAFVDGEVDPWRPVGPHGKNATDRISTASEPFVLIEDAVHHWDENGVFANETTAERPPLAVRDAQALERMFVEAWLLGM
ncbi:hypothetical protein M501DRAFT_1010061 [Patellaria atrata CBS 101060]|uniref:Uncharacterized protein n=1 Tax=Patellaria atrata CBS 101060 TaxID=1346257 RepID=A0A9P4SDQ9_9PEZI|nr:hypothetical protein M501DRAFT_1010061 [Patellaria atrata CBS 101060]